MKKLLLHEFEKTWARDPLDALFFATVLPIGAIGYASLVLIKVAQALL